MEEDLISCTEGDFREKKKYKIHSSLDNTVCSNNNGVHRCDSVNEFERNSRVDVKESW